MSETFENIKMTIPGLAAGADLRTKQNLFMKISGDCAVNVAGDGEQAVGVLQNKPNSGEAATVATFGSVARVIAGEAITAGMVVSSMSTGKAQEVNDTEIAVGIALTGCSNADEVISVFLCSLGTPD